MDKTTIPVAILLLTLGNVANAAQPSAKATAQRIDAAIADELFNDETQLAPPSDDETFLRRVWLDLLGDIPTPEGLTAFVLDPSLDKRERTVRRLLESPYYGQNWARYWRDVVFSRTLEERAYLAANAMEADLAGWLNKSEGWDKIASRFITAHGNILEHGNTAIMMAQDGRTEETTAEISRIFLGIQIQCAQCHDHPYDRWKREQFHELAAFFPRIGVRPVRGITKRSFEVFSSDRFGRKKPKKDNDRRPQAEHFMPDLDNPTAKGTEIQPKFFLTGATLPFGANDVQRRSQLAQWLTENEWFSIALVNRIWSELVGEGFYEPVDDIGPDREATVPKAVKLLANQFRQSDYDLKWLFRTICQTEAYGRESRPRRTSGETPFTANVPQRLRSDQLFSAAHSALDIRESIDSSPRPRRSGPRQQFAQTFGYDPSVSRDNVSASIPQVLALMNSPRINRALAANRSSLLGHLLDEVGDDEQLIVELYLRCLSRQPTEEELSLLLAYGEEVGNRRQAFEDLLWSLINSAEFQYRK